MLKEALQYILDGMRPETQDLCGRAYVITPSGAQEVIETPIAPATLQLHSLDSIVKMIRTEAIHLADTNMQAWSLAVIRAGAFAPISSGCWRSTPLGF